MDAPVFLPDAGVTGPLALLELLTKVAAEGFAEHLLRHEEVRLFVK